MGQSPGAAKERPCLAALLITVSNNTKATRILRKASGLRIPSAAMLGGVHGGKLKFLGVGVRQVCDGSQEPSSRVAGGHSTALLVRSRALSQAGNRQWGQFGLSFRNRTSRKMPRHGVPNRDSYEEESVNRSRTDLKRKTPDIRH
jgi:hypothetical protein